MDVSNDDDITGSCTDISDEKLFADPPPKEDCQICLLPMPHASGVSKVRITYMPCCGKTLCEGCVLESEDEMNKGGMKRWCPFCRIPIQHIQIMNLWRD